MKKTTACAIGAACVLSPSVALADTYYVAASGGSDANAGSQSEPWSTFKHAFGVLKPSDALIVRDGAYPDLSPTVSGTASQRITIRAEHDGAAILGQISLSQVSYLDIEGFTVKGQGEQPALSLGSPDGTPVAAQTHDVAVRRVGVKGSANLDNVEAASIARARDVLLEDVWAWGLGRYTLNIYGATRVTVRRAVLRWDGWDGTNYKPDDPKFNLGVYDSHECLFENVLLLDAAAASGGGEKGGLYVPGNDNGNTAPYTNSADNRFYGLIILGNDGYGFGVEGGTGLINTNNSFKDVVVWANTAFGVTVPDNTTKTTLDHITVARSGDFGLYDGVGGEVTMTNSVVYDHPGAGLNGGPSPSYSNVYGNSPDYKNSAAGQGSISKDPQFKYIARSEPGSPDQGTAGDGGDRGATVVKRYTDGALTGVDLWPWPNQKRIQAEMCEGVTRGFCGKQSVTEYIWTYLGAENPYPGEAPEVDGGTGSPPDGGVGGAGSGAGGNGDTAGRGCGCRVPGRSREGSPDMAAALALAAALVVGRALDRARGKALGRTK